MPRLPSRPLAARFYARDTVRVARALLGCILETRLDGVRTAGRIVEVEAYVGVHDPAAHGYGGRVTERNRDLFGSPGTAYVYRSYGVHWCFNAVTERSGVPAAVLVRALEPLAGLEAMTTRRGGLSNEHLLCAGPGRLCAALGISGTMSGAPLDGAPLRVLGPRPRDGRPRVGTSGRIGVSRAADWPLRFFIEGSPWVSRRRTR